jgi:hypothetical protein
MVGGVVSKLAAVVGGGLVAGDVVTIGTVVVVGMTGVGGGTIAGGTARNVVVVLSVVGGSVGREVPLAAACRVDA